MDNHTRNIVGIGFGLFPVVVAVAAAVIFFFASPAHPRDNGQWEATDADVKKWYKDLMRPDNPRMSCCGESDAYHADSFRSTVDAETGEASYIAVITDERDDKPLYRPHVPVGTEIVVPNTKLKHDKGNPTGHGVIFMNAKQEVFCYVTPGGG